VLLEDIICRMLFITLLILQIKSNSVVLVHERTIPTQLPPLVGSTQLLRIGDVAWSAQRIPYGRILIFTDRSRYYFFPVAPQLHSQGWVDPVPDPLIIRKSDSAGNRTRTSRPVARNSDHWTTEAGKHKTFLMRQKKTVGNWHLA
jgi:hypothetical protein